MTDTLKKTSFETSARTVQTQDINLVTKKQVLTDNIKFYGNKYHNNGRPNLACYVVLDRTNGDTIARTTTDKFGYYEFVVPKTSLTSGYYHVKFHGSGTVPAFKPEGDWEVIEVVDADLIGTYHGLEPLVIDGTPNFQVSESTLDHDLDIDINKTEWTTAQIDITSFTATQGALAGVVVYMKRAEATTYQLLETFDVDSSDIKSSYQFKKKITLSGKPTTYYDFYVMFMGSNKEFAKSGGNPVQLYDLDVPFNGITDLAEYLEVRYLTMINATNGEEGALQSNFAKLQWEEIRDVNSGDFPIALPNGFDSTAVNLYYVQAQKVTGYVVYMYVSDDNVPPTNKYPVTDGADSGAWFFVAETEKNIIEIRCPFGKYVAFWVGMKTGRTDTISNLYTVREVLKY